MSDPLRWYQTTAIDYPNSRPHIGTAFEKLGADVQARYRRQQGYRVFFLMGNDENTIKVAKRAAELGQAPQPYCDEMAQQFRATWDALDVSYDTFIQTSHERHKQCCRKFIQKVYDNGYIYKANYEGWYCNGCEEFKTDKVAEESGQTCPSHQTPLVRRSEECYKFKLTAFQDRLLAYYEENPDFIQPESRRNEMLSLIQNEGLLDVNITRTGEDWGIRLPFDERYTIYVWFDALLTYITGIGYGDDEAEFATWWPVDIHFIGKDITRFHCALWPAMLWAAGLEAPRRVFSHGFVYIKGEKISKSLDNVVNPMDLITRFNVDAFRYYFLRECPFPGDGDFSWERFEQLYDADLANNLGNLFSRVVTLVTKNYEGVLEDPPGRNQAVIYENVGIEETVKQVQAHIGACQYHLALQKIWQQVLDPTNQYVERSKPWSLVKTDKVQAAGVLAEMVEQLRAASILLKPFLPRSAETIYKGFDFPQPWEEVRYEDAWLRPHPAATIRVIAPLTEGKVKPLFPRIR